MNYIYRNVKQVLHCNLQINELLFGIRISYKYHNSNEIQSNNCRTFYNVHDHISVDNIYYKNYNDYSLLNNVDKCYKFSFLKSILFSFYQIFHVTVENENQEKVDQEGACNIIQAAFWLFVAS